MLKINTSYNWYKKRVFSALNSLMNGNRFEITPNPKGDLFRYIGNKRVTDILKGIGFRWSGDKTTSMWWADINRLQNNPEAISVLENLGVDVSPIQQNAPAERVNTPPARESSSFILAESIAIPNLPKGHIVAVYSEPRLGPDKWAWVDEEGNYGEIPSRNKADIQNYVRAIRDEMGQRISGRTTFDIFNKYHEMKQNENDEKEPEEVEDKDIPDESVEEKSGRIPPERISSYQKNIETAFNGSEENLVVNALAGTGKTTVLKHLASFKDPSEPWLYLVFNKKNQLEAEPDFKKIGVDVLTSHSFLGKMLKTVPNEEFPIGSLETSYDKTAMMVKDALEMSREIPRNFKVKRDKYPNGRVYYNAKVALLNIVEKCKANAVDPMSKNLLEEISKVIDQYDIETDIQNKDKKGNPVGPPIEVRDELTREAARILVELMPEADTSRYARVPKESGSGFWNNQRKYQGVYGHDDTLWYSAMNGQNIQWPFYSVVLVDEVQDFNKCQQIMLQNLMENGSRIVAVGDPNQSIYMFRGADSNSFSRVQEIVGGNNQSYDLPVNYRCGKAIIDYVNNSDKSPVSNLQAGLSHEGKVVEGQAHYDAINSVIEEYHQNGEKLKMPTAFIARTNQILQEAALQFIKEDVEFEFIGFNMSRELLNLCTEVVGRGRYKKNLSMSEFYKALSKKFSGLSSLLDRLIGTEKRKSEDKQRIFEAINHLIEDLTRQDDQGNIFYYDEKNKKHIKTSNDFITFIMNKFKGLNFESESDSEIERVKKFQERDPREYVALCSAHRSKGLEFERVYVLGHDQFPSKRARTEKEIAQEHNAWYVALTRAKDELHIPDPPPRD
jgi:hypothetical protein